MISYLSQRLAVILSEYVGRTTEVDYLRYGIEIMIRGAIKFLTLLITAYILGLFLPMVTVVITFTIFRFLTGGHHYSTYLRCLFVGLFMMLSISFIAIKLSNFVESREIFIMLFFTVLIGLFLSSRYAPSNHFYKKITENQKRKLKNYSLVAIIIWGAAMYYLIFNTFSTEIILASLFGFLFQIGSIHPHSYLFVNRVEQMIDRRGNF